MTDIEAIERLKAHLEWGFCKATTEALNMAIKALERENADGCSGCAFETVEEWELPCRKCNRSCKDYWRAKRSE